MGIGLHALVATRRRAVGGLGMGHSSSLATSYRVWDISSSPVRDHNWDRARFYAPRDAGGPAPRKACQILITCV